MVHDLLQFTEYHEHLTEAEVDNIVADGWSNLAPETEPYVEHADFRSLPSSKTPNSQFMEV